MRALSPSALLGAYPGSTPSDHHLLDAREQLRHERASNGDDDHCYRNHGWVDVAIGNREDASEPEESTD